MKTHLAITRPDAWMLGTLASAAAWLQGVVLPVRDMLMAVTLIIIYDAWTAYELDRRVRRKYRRRPARFTSWKFARTVTKLLERYAIIVLASAAEIHIAQRIFDVPLAATASLAIFAEQLLSIAENKCSCRTAADAGQWQIWRVVSDYVQDKTWKHLRDEDADPTYPAAPDEDAAADDADAAAHGTTP